MQRKADIVFQKLRGGEIETVQGKSKKGSRWAGAGRKGGKRKAKYFLEGLGENVSVRKALFGAWGKVVSVKITGFPGWEFEFQAKRLISCASLESIGLSLHT